MILQISVLRYNRLAGKMWYILFGIYVLGWTNETAIFIGQKLVSLVSRGST